MLENKSQIAIAHCPHCNQSYTLEKSLIAALIDPQFSMKEIAAITSQSSEQVKQRCGTYQTTRRLIDWPSVI
jgi:hypothetical protein